ncbi:hypothetical protein [Nesterenkonia haasae]|nr:hypothetical protein [Nesterenkonia haasae]
MNSIAKLAPASRAAAITIHSGPHTNPMFTGGLDPDAARFWRP